MKLLVNGCSFTGGNDNIHDENGNLNPTPDYVWSNHTGVDTTNISIAGNSNDKIIRTTLEHLKQNDMYMKDISTLPVPIDRPEYERKNMTYDMSNLL